MIARILRLGIAAPLLTASVSVTAAVSGVAPPASCAAATYTHHVALVVEHGDGQVLRACIGFDGGTITGKEILDASRIEYASAGYGSLGSAVCQIDSEPSSYPPGCWTSNSPYWAMFVSRGGGGWSVAERGISSETFADGDAEGFRYDPQRGAPPPVSPAGTCRLAAVNPSAPTNPPAAQATAGPTSVSSAQATARPQSAPTASGGGQPNGTAVPTPGLVGPAPLARTAAHPQGLDPALVGAAAAGGALAAVLAMQWLRRRRRA